MVQLIVHQVVMASIKPFNILDGVIPWLSALIQFFWPQVST
jgi:hypothetical protein